MQWGFILQFFSSDAERGSPKPEMDSRDQLEERVSTRGSAPSPTGGHVADIYLANLKWVACLQNITILNICASGISCSSLSSSVKLSKHFVSFRLKKRPEPGNIRRAFRSESDSMSPAASSSGAGGARTAPLTGGAQVKDSGDKRPVSAHNILNSVTRHSSLKTKVQYM